MRVIGNSLLPCGGGLGRGESKSRFARVLLPPLSPPRKGEGKSALAPPLALAVLLSACQSSPPKDYAEFRSPQDPATVASRLSENIGACWFAGARPAFAQYSYAPELNSFSGRPRILVVPKTDPGGLPKLVVEASEAERGASVKLFGPLMASAEASAISRDIERWAGGASGC